MLSYASSVEDDNEIMKRKDREESLPLIPPQEDLGRRTETRSYSILSIHFLAGGPFRFFQATVEDFKYVDKANMMISYQYESSVTPIPYKWRFSTLYS